MKENFVDEQCDFVDRTIDRTSHDVKVLKNQIEVKQKLLAKLKSMACYVEPYSIFIGIENFHLLLLRNDNVFCLVSLKRTFQLEQVFEYPHVAGTMIVVQEIAEFKDKLPTLNEINILSGDGNLILCENGYDLGSHCTREKLDFGKHYTRKELVRFMINAYIAHHAVKAHVLTYRNKDTFWQSKEYKDLLGAFGQTYADDWQLEFEDDEK